MFFSLILAIALTYVFPFPTAGHSDAMFPSAPYAHAAEVGHVEVTDHASQTLLIKLLTSLESALERLFNAFQRSTSSVSDQDLKPAITTVFWVGERANRSNDHIANSQSAWDGNWKQHYGGTDDPHDRCGYAPCDFTPKENPFYVALPYNDLDEDGEQKKDAQEIPWYTEVSDGESLLKNHWVEVRANGQTCYGQWEDVGPGEEDDFEYVFGDAEEPENTFGEEAGLDVSPALAECLKIKDVGKTTWRFVNADEVPKGPWKDIITTSPVAW